MATGTAWTVLLAAADTRSEGPQCPSARVLHGFGALAKPGAKRQTQAGVAGWPVLRLQRATLSPPPAPYGILLCVDQSEPRVVPLAVAVVVLHNSR